MIRLDYSIAGEFAEFVRALAIVESNEHPLLSGDGGRAYGLLQIHPATFQEYYGHSRLFPKSAHHTWLQAEILTCASFLHINGDLQLSLRVQAWNLGVQAILDGKRNSEYLAKFEAALKRVHEGLALCPIG